MAITKLTPEEKFVNELGWCSITLATWAQNEFRNGASLEQVQHRVRRAMQIAESIQTKETAQ